MKEIQTLKQALPYMRRHKGRTFVVKLGGELAARPKLLASLASDLSLLVHVGIRVAVVHGGGPQATAMSERLGLESRVVGGRRVTDAETLEVAKMVFAGGINVDILSALRMQGVRAVGLSGVDGGILHAERRAPVSMQDSVTGEATVVDFGHVGDVKQVDTHLITLLMDEGYVPVISSLASDQAGNVLNVNADTVASVVASKLGAAKLLLLTTAPGLLSDPDDPQSLVARLDVDEARQLLDGPSVQGGMKPKLAALVAAVEGGVERGHILSGTESSALLLELFTKDGCGTLVHGAGELVGLASSDGAGDSGHHGQADDVGETEAPGAAREGLSASLDRATPADQGAES